jgi:transposase
MVRSTIDNREARVRHASYNCRIDLEKDCSSFTAAKGRAVLRKQLGRGRLLGFLANLPHCLVVPEACASAHYWAREIEKLGSSLLNR